MTRYDDVIEFLDRIYIRELVRQEDLESVYTKYGYSSCDLTEYLLEVCNVQPDLYMSYIPSGFLRSSKIIKEYNISNSVKRICDEAFYLSRVSNVTIPDGVEIVGKKAFAICHYLTTVRIPNNVQRIEDEAFYDCRWLTEVSIPGSVTHIGSMAFSRCGMFDATGVTIHFGGTKQQFRSITRGAFKDTYYIAYCSDGVVTKRRK